MCLTSSLKRLGITSTQAKFACDTIANSIRESSANTYLNIIKKHAKWPLQSEEETVAFLISARAACKGSIGVALAAAKKLHDNIGWTPVPDGPLVDAYKRGIDDTPRDAIYAALEVSRAQSLRQPEKFHTATVINSLLNKGNSRISRRDGTLLLLTSIATRRFNDLSAIRTSHIFFSDAKPTRIVIPPGTPTKNKKRNCLNPSEILIPNEQLPQLAFNPSEMLLQYTKWLKTESHCSDPFLAHNFLQQRGNSRPISTATFGTNIRKACEALGLPTAGVGAHIGKFALPSVASDEDCLALAQQSGIAKRTLETHYAGKSTVKEERVLSAIRRGTRNWR